MLLYFVLRTVKVQTFLCRNKNKFNKELVFMNSFRCLTTCVQLFKC